MYEAFPLQWPAGYDRAPKRQSSLFKTTPDKARKHLVKEIEALSGDKNPVISSNVPLRKDGQMYADMASDQLKDPGVAIYFMYKDNQVTLACDNWLTPAENIRALGCTVEAMRGMDRWKCSDIIGRAFTGFTALPESSTGTDIWDILGLNVKPATKEEVTADYKEKVKIHHPDVPGGNHERFVILQTAYKQALSFFK